MANSTAVDRVMGRLHMSGLDYRRKVEGEYTKGWHRYGLQRLRPGDTLVDIGGNLGIVPVVAHWLVPCLTIVTVEPVPENYLFLEWNLHDNVRRRANATCSHAAVTAVNRGLSLSRSNVSFKVGTRSMNARASNIFTHDEEADAVGGTMDPVLARRSATHRSFRDYIVPTSTLEDLLHETNVSTVDLLKLDCEGCEFDVVQELKSKPQLAARIRQVTGEVHGCNMESEASRCNEALRFIRQRWPHSAHSVFSA